MRKVCLVLLLALCQLVCLAQIDKVFWFAVPEVISDHGDSPILLRVTSFEKTTNVKVSFPAIPSSSPMVISLAANSSQSINLTTLKNQLENDEPDVVSNKGILIEATSEITAYYEVNAENNPDIFTLKGRNALGKEFYTPFQVDADNWSNYEAYSSVDIVATEDSTLVTITPTVDVVGHAKGGAYTVLLNKGQTYSIRAMDGLRDSHPKGTHITSTKPIAVTIKDDSVFNNDSKKPYASYDLIGDQLIPTSKIGEEYLLTFGVGYVMATQDSTIVTWGTNDSAILNIGQIFPVSDGIRNVLPALIQTSKPTYVLQVGGIGDELGGAILPSLGCTGSKKIAFTQSTGGEFILMVITKKGGEGAFTLNGNKSYVTSSDFIEVGNGWVSAEIDLTGLFDAGQVFSLVNEKTDFHLGIRNGTGSTGARFGYFSDFGVLDLGIDQTFCEGEETNMLDAGISKDSYLWNTGETTQTISVDTGGVYSVTVTKGICTFSDSVEIAIVENVSVKDLGNDTVICFGDSLVLLPGGNEFAYLWQDQSTDTLFMVKEKGRYEVKVSNENGCFKTESISVELLYKPEVSLGNDTIICSSSEYLLRLKPDLGMYLWSTGSGDSSIVISEPGFYSVNVTNECGSDADGVIVDFWKVEIPNIITPNQDGKNDFFTIAGLEEGEWSLVVRNRWGDEVYNNPAYQNTFSPERLSDGMYYYYLKEQSECNEFIGWLLIER